MEGKYRPTQLGPKKGEGLGNNVGIILRTFEAIFSIGKCVMLESVFCV